MRATALGSIANLQNSLFVTACESAARHKVVGFQARAAAFLTGCSGPGVRQHLLIAHVEHLSSAGFKAALLISRPDLGSFDRHGGEVATHHRALPIGSGRAKLTKPTTPRVHAGGFCLLALVPRTVGLRVAPLAALSSAISFKAESSSAQAPMLCRSAYTIH
jgi:hypothetical protein